jgi:integrase/recombinase XerD
MPKRTTPQLSGPLAEHAQEFRPYLVELGYSASPIKKHLQLLTHLDRWLGAEAIALDQLDEAVAEPFFERRRQEGRSNLLTTQALVPLLGYLRRKGALAGPPRRDEEGPCGAVLARFRTYLLSERGVVEGTARFYLHVARLFLSARGRDLDLGLGQLMASDITNFTAAACAGRSISSSRQVVSALRCLLRFLRFEGLAPPALDQAVLSVAGSDPSLPRGASPAQVEAVLASCERNSAMGLRDYAILALLARLGLRDGELVALELGDIDWRAGEVHLKRKGGRRERLPLTAEAGAALAAYLAHGRPKSQSRSVFLRHYAPITGLSGTGAVRDILAKACRRAGCPYMSPHRLRHSLASAMLAAGVPLYDIGQVLGHRSPRATATYAKVDFIALGGLAGRGRRWAGERPSCPVGRVPRPAPLARLQACAP